MEQRGKVPLASREALLVAGGGKGRHSYSRATQEVFLSGGCWGRGATGATSPAWAGSQGGSCREQIGFSDCKMGMQNARRNFD